jgi:hypothetical protein
VAVGLVVVAVDVFAVRVLLPQPATAIATAAGASPTIERLMSE